MLRFSPRTNRAHLVKWREWGTEAFQEAQQQDKLVVVFLTAFWCGYCQRMDETVELGCQHHVNEDDREHQCDREVARRFGQRPRTLKDRETLGDLAAHVAGNLLQIVIRVGDDSARLLLESEDLAYRVFEIARLLETEDAEFLEGTRAIFAYLERYEATPYASGHRQRYYEHRPAREAEAPGIILERATPMSGAQR